jgi:hypothetical protein
MVDWKLKQLDAGTVVFFGTRMHIPFATPKLAKCRACFQVFHGTVSGEKDDGEAIRGQVIHLLK